MHYDYDNRLEKKMCFEFKFDNGQTTPAGGQRVPNRMGQETETALSKLFSISFGNFEKFYI